MGTNYYTTEKPCPTCGHAEEGRHLGKLSTGWVFCFRGTPGIRNFSDWKAAIEHDLAKGLVIVEGSNNEFPFQALLRIIALAAGGRQQAKDYPDGGNSWIDWNGHSFTGVDFC